MVSRASRCSPCQSPFKVTILVSLYIPSQSFIRRVITRKVARPEFYTSSHWTRTIISLVSFIFSPVKVPAENWHSSISLSLGVTSCKLSGFSSSHSPGPALLAVEASNLFFFAPI